MDTTPFDLAFRPESYWPFEDSDAGKATNEMTYRIRRAEQSGDWSRVVLPAVPFALRGGDFLPRRGKFEIEIARVSLESTTWDVISIRARPTKSGIRYRIVDEYGSDITSLWGMSNA